MFVVPSVEFQRNIALFHDRALVEPVFITQNGREQLVMIAAEEYRRLKRWDHESLAASELSDDDLQAIALAEIPHGYGHLDAELQQ